MRHGNATLRFIDHDYPDGKTELQPLVALARIALGRAPDEVTLAPSVLGSRCRLIDPAIATSAVGIGLPGRRETTTPLGETLCFFSEENGSDLRVAVRNTTNPYARADWQQFTSRGDVRPVPGLAERAYYRVDPTQHHRRIVYLREDSTILQVYMTCPCLAGAEASADLTGAELVLLRHLAEEFRMVNT